MNAAESGIVVVDKPAGLTSHDVVARIRRMAGTRRVGHAGTLDPMATGVLVVGVEKATRLLGYLAATEKSYLATIRLGQATDTDDAEGAVTSHTSAADVSDEALRKAVAALTGDIQQVPPGVSAIKVAGQRAYRLARRGDAPDLAPRRVTVREFVIRQVRAGGDLRDVDVAVTCSSGTYVRALARDLGAALGVGGHLTSLRRTRVGGYRVEAATTLDRLADRFEVTPLAAAAAAAFPRRDVTEEQARVLSHGGWLPAAGLHAPAAGLDAPAAGLDALAAGSGSGPTAVFGPDGSLVALVRDEDGRTRPLAVFA